MKVTTYLIRMLIDVIILRHKHKTIVGDETVIET